MGKWGILENTHCLKETTHKDKKTHQKGTSSTTHNCNISGRMLERFSEKIRRRSEWILKITIHRGRSPAQEKFTALKVRMSQLARMFFSPS